MQFVIVRVADPGDIAGVLELEQAVPDASHWVAEVYGAMVFAEDALKGGVRRRLVIAESEGRIVGFAVASVAGTALEQWGELESVAVAEGWRRQGVGGRLCAAVINWCAAEGARWMELEVRAGALAVQRMYAGMGFREVGRRRGYYRHPVDDAVLMRAEMQHGRDLRSSGPR